MVLLLSLTPPSFRGIVIWLRAFLGRTSAYLKACLRLMLALARNPSTRFHIIEGNKRERKTSASSQAPSCVVAPNVEPHGPASCGVQEADVMASAQNPVTELPRNLALTDMYTTRFAAHTEVETGNRVADMKLQPILALNIQEKRYERDPRIQLPQNYSYSAPPGVPDFSEKIDDAWQPITHPEGALFFYGTRKRVVTEADVRQGTIATKIETAINMLCNLLTENVTIPATAELVLDVDEDSNNCGYYFVDHDSKSLFWFESHTQLLPQIFDGLPATRKSHIKYAYERQYWIHCDLFPNKRIVQADIMVRLKCIIMHAYAETVTSETSLTPYSADDLSSLMTLIGPLNESVGETHEHSICIIARLMDTLTWTQFINFCGQPAARLDVDTPLLQQEKEPGWKMLLLYFLNIAFFGSLQSHKQSIEQVWVDETVVATRWRSFFDSLKAEWTGFTVFSTVMLAVDVSFLAVPGVNPSSVQSQPASQILTYLSTLCAMGSLISSLILASQIQALRSDNVDGAGTLLLGMSNSLLGLDGLALIHGLPFSLLIWAMIFFTIALSTTMFHSTALVTLGVVGSMFALVLLLTGWLILAINDLHISSLIRSSSEV